MIFLVNLLVTIISVILGGYILFVGRKAAWVTLGTVSLIVTGNLLAVLFAGADKARDLIELQSWGLVGIAVLVGFLGFAVGRANKDWAVLLIGFAAGADMALWLYDVSAYAIKTVAQQSERTAFWVGLIILVVGGLLGMWLVSKARDEALILITMLVGTQFIQNSLGLSKDSSWTAIIMITLALAGVLVQFADYLREIKANQQSLEPQASSIAYFQDLELEL